MSGCLLGGKHLFYIDNPLAKVQIFLELTHWFIGVLELRIYVGRITYLLAQRFFNARNSSGAIVKVQLLNLMKLNLNKIWKKKKKQTLIDVVLTTNENIVNACEVMSSAISDHSLVCVTLKMKAPKPRCTYITVRSYKNYTINSLRT